MICGYELSEIALHEIAHFAWGLGWGLLAYWLMVTMLSRMHWDGKIWGRDFGIYRFSLLVALSLVVASHIWEDYFLKWF